MEELSPVAETDCPGRLLCVRMVGLLFCEWGRKNKEGKQSSGFPSPKGRPMQGRQQLLPPRPAAPCVARCAGDAGLLASAPAAPHPAGPGTAGRGESRPRRAGKDRLGLASISLAVWMSLGEDQNLGAWLPHLETGTLRGFVVITWGQCPT